MPTFDPVEIWEASPFLASMMFIGFLIWIGRKYPEKPDVRSNGKADDLFSENNQLFRIGLQELRDLRAANGELLRAMLAEQREIRAGLIAIHNELVRNGKSRN